MLNLASVAALALLAQAAPVKPATVFLAAKARTNVRNDCLGALTTAFKAEVAKTKGILAVTARAGADIVVEVPECATASTTNMGGEIEVVGTRGERQGTSGRVGVGGNPLASPVASVVLTVDDEGVLREFNSGPQALPKEEATRIAVQSLLAWVRSRTPEK